MGQATNSCGAIARMTYNRLFLRLIDMCNRTLLDPTMKKANCCCVLDIAGFEIFEYNGFEQISINFVNEKLQQFFNHHMFVVEQEEYLSEGIEWAMVDFGMDLQACIIMFEKPMGIWAILEEESLFPKATDASFEEKLKQQHMGKSPPFAKPNRAEDAPDPDAHFAIIHYAGTVSYNVTAWLEKNKDPVNDTVADVLKRSVDNEILVLTWADHPGQSFPEEEQGKDGKKKKKKGASKTVSGVYLVQLNSLMDTLNSTEPHFIRCIVPNNHKKPLMVEPPLIMHQLTCNGVLEGIRICMRGFPNRILYPEFKQRYWILAKKELYSSDDNKTGCYALMDKIEFDRDKYRLGHTKVFFKAGALALLEEFRDDIVNKLIRWVQGNAFGTLARKRYQFKYDQRALMSVIQRNYRKYMMLRDWGWYILLNGTKKMIGMQDVEGELGALEAQCNAVYGEYEEQINTKKQLLEENQALKEEKKAMTKQISEEQGNIGEYTERQAMMSAAKADLETTLEERTKYLAVMEEERLAATEDKKGLEAENNIYKKDCEDLELAIQKLEQEKTNRDHTIRFLNDEISAQDEAINKLNKEKKHVTDSSSKASEDLQVVEEKANHLSNVKSQLEATLDELEDSLTREKRSRAEIDKARRKVEGNLRVTQESVTDLERLKKELENTVGRKEKEYAQLASKMEDEQGIVAKTQKGIKELQGRVEELEEELEAERQARAKAEKKRSELAREYEQLGERLVESSGATSCQIELNKKREMELGKLRKDIEEQKIQQETTMINLKRKHNDAVAEMTEQIDQLAKMKAKVDKDKNGIHAEIQDVRAAVEEVTRAKASAEKSNKTLINQLNELNKKVEEANLTLTDYEASKRKIAAENGDLLRQLQEMENSANMMAKVKSQLVSQLDEARQIADDEAKERHSLLGKFKNLEHELEGVKEQMEEEVGAKAEILRQLGQRQQEADQWRQKYEIDALAKAEELEMSKMKLQARLAEAQSTIEQLNSKLVQVEKAKQKLQSEIEDISAKADQAHLLNNSMEKKARQFDKIICEWKGKVDSLSMDLDCAQKECRNVSSELYRVKNAYEESILQLDEVRKENKSLSNEIKDIMDQISEGGRSIHEIDKIRKRLEAEKLELG